MTLLRITRALALFALTLPAANATAATLFFDFGETTQPTAFNYNNVSQTQLPIFNAIDSTGASTGISLVTAGFNPGSNPNGTQTPTGAAAIFQPQATRDNLFGHTQFFGTTPPFPQATLTIGGLDGTGATTYDFTFFAGRLGVTDNRETRYNVVGASSGDVYLDAANNSSNTVTLAGVVPTAAGSVVVTMTPGPNNTNSTGFFYLGAMRIASNVVPEPTTLALSSAAVAVVLLARGRARG